ncbi:MAG: TetR/AcrR family transcriptional regulator [Caldilineaceae bacterium]
MPHQTFFNLPEEKRQQILQVAIDEFAENDYDNVSISRIVARAGIAKGSFYQYFADKEDLYGHLLSLLAKAKTDFMSLDHPDPNHIGIFAYLRWMAEVGVAFQMAYPQFSKIAVRAANANFFPRSFNVNIREQTIAFYRRLAEVGQAQGDIDPGIDPAVAAVIFDGALTSIANYMLDKFASGEIPLKLEGDDMFNMPEISKIFTAAVDLLEHGMRKQVPSQSTGQMQVAEGPLAVTSGIEGG